MHTAAQQGDGVGGGLVSVHSKAQVTGRGRRMKDHSNFREISGY